MAKTQDEKTVETTQAAETANPVKPIVNPWKTMRRVYVPNAARNEQPTLLVNVNDKSYAVPMGRFVDVPQPVYEVIQNMLDQRAATEAQAQRDFSPKP